MVTLCHILSLHLNIKVWLKPFFPGDSADSPVQVHVSSRVEEFAAAFFDVCVVVVHTSS